MNIFSLILLAFAVSIDGFWGGFAFGLKKVKISPVSLLIISSWSVICTMIVMFIGCSLKNIISFEWAKFLGAALLFLLGLFTLKGGYKQKKEHLECKRNFITYNIKFKDLIKVLHNPLLADIDNENDIKPAEGTILGLAVAMDASIAAFTVSLLGFNPLITPFLFGVTHYVLIGSGNFIARQNVINHFSEKFSMLPGIILIALAILRLV
ncbi:MAG: sporulation rane protein YtaF [Clostridiales bacterium]|jgi:putative sporulation protein YtaF|nr:sporulation rane protein YtaF [Clostridiales bacterium]